MTTSTAIDLSVRSHLAILIARHRDSQKALALFRSEGAHARRLTGTKTGGAAVSTSAQFVEDRIVRNELWLTLVDQRRNYVLATEIASHLQERHLDQLDSWADSIQRRLANAWDIRHRASIISQPKDNLPAG